MGRQQPNQSHGSGTNTHNDHATADIRFSLLPAPSWESYELIDSGYGKKLERFGPYRLVRPETQAIWPPALPQAVWDDADAHFEQNREDDGPGQWGYTRSVPDQWTMSLDNLVVWVRLTPFRHTGIFPEHTAHWAWVQQRIRSVYHQPHVLVLFGYTGLTTLVAARSGARVCHVDASKPAIRWARENQAASQLDDRPVRWIVDDAIKFVKREQRRGNRYDLIIMDPPIFGRGPKGEIWRLHESLPLLVEACVRILSDRPVGVLMNAYATAISSLTLYNILTTAMKPYSGDVVAGELVLQERTAHRPLSAALYAYWQNRETG